MSKYPTVSVCMIVRNEETNLPRALLSVRKVADEIIVVDTGSTDSTVETARRHGAKVYHFDWCDDFSAARNESLRHATKDYVMWIDGDDEFDAAGSKRLKKILKTNFGMAFYFRIVLLFDTYKEECYQIRLFPRKKEIMFEGRVHEQPNYSISRSGVPNAAVDIRVIHHGYKNADDIPRKLHRNLGILEAELARSPEDIVARFFLARTNMGLRRLDATVSLYKEVIGAAETDGSFRKTEYWRMSHIDLVNMLALKGEYGEAKTYIRSYADTFGADFFAYYYCGSMLFQEGDYAGALKEFSSAEGTNLDLCVFPINRPRMIGKLHAFAGFCLAKEGKPAEAKEHIRQALEVCENDGEVVDVSSDTYMILKDSEGLSAVLSKMTPDTGKYHYKMGMCRIYEENMTDALTELEKAVSLGFRTKNCLSALMLCCERTGDLDRAIAIGKECASVYFDDRGLPKRLFDLYIKASRYDEASALLEGLNGSRDMEMMAAAVYLSTLRNDWEGMLVGCIELHRSVLPDVEPSLEKIVGLEGALAERGEHQAARHIKKSIAAFIENSPF